MRPTTVCFDLGGVLVRIRTDWSHAQTSGEPGQARAIEEPAIFGMFQAGDVSSDHYVAGLADYLGLSPGAAREAHGKVLVEPYPGTLDLVLELEGRGVRTGCLSNTNQLHWDRMMDPLEFPAVARLHTKVASHLVRASKPEPQIFRAYEELSGAEPAEIVYFDDSHGHVRAAKALGWQAYRVDPEMDTAAQMRGILQTFDLL